MASKNEAIVASFRRFDDNGDGVISEEELGRVLKQLDPKTWGDKEIHVLMGAVDVNHDGGISYEEFVDWISGSGDDSLKKSLLPSSPGGRREAGKTKGKTKAKHAAARERSSSTSTAASSTLLLPPGSSALKSSSLPELHPAIGRSITAPPPSASLSTSSSPTDRRMSTGSIPTGAPSTERRMSADASLTMARRSSINPMFVGKSAIGRRFAAHRMRHGSDTHHVSEAPAGFSAWGVVGREDEIVDSRRNSLDLEGQPERIRQLRLTALARDPEAPKQVDDDEPA